MQKVVYNVTRYRRDDVHKMSGVGYITEKDLIIACISKNGNPYIRVFEDALERCFKSTTKEDEFSGTYSELKEIEVEKNTNGHVSLETIEIEIEYHIWYKFVV